MNIFKQHLWVMIIFFILIALGLGILVVRGNQPEEMTPVVQVKASIYPFAFLAEKIGGEWVNVTTITPAGVEPHDFEPSAREIAQLESADLIIISGELEPWAEAVAAQPEIADSLVKLHDGETGPDPDEEQVHDHHDPHTWLSPVEMQVLAAQVTQALIEVDPAHQEQYLQNQDDLVQELVVLDQEYRQGLAHCRLNTFITAHEAFGYLAAEYELEQIGITGLSPEEEPTLQDLASLAEIARSKEINYIFFEELISPKLSETLANEVGAQTLVLNPLESLPSDRLELGEDYFSVMKENLTNLRLALSCQ